MPRRSRRAALLVALASLALALAAAELLVRAAGVAPEVSPVRRGRIQLSANPRLVFEPVPALEVAEAGLWDGWSGAANRLGYRDRDRPVDKPAGAFRVVVLGDSIAEGLGADDSAAIFPALLEGHLAAAGRPVEVLNFAVTGYNTAQEVETLAARALAFSPDLVLLAYCLNDRRPPDPRLVAALREEAAQPGAVAPAALGGAKRLLLRSALFRLAWLHVASPPEVELPPGIDPEAPPPRPHQIAARFEDGVPVAGPAAVEAAFARLAGIAESEAAAGRGFEVAVVVFPYFERLFRAPYADHHRHVAALATRHGFAYLDLGPAFRECQRESPEPVAYDRYHPTAAGHACAAEAIGGFLTNEGLVPEQDRFDQVGGGDPAGAGLNRSEGAQGR
ncbi:MAG TPA: SGNH/GDSL hydrolase family protein, partial [Thermoanaerobaculia bacterium]|nr:SGNH/GDSL hydrolase family protein [Thermoanaerobaculia bacterium]